MMSAARVTAGSLLALFVVGAVVHYRSARHASSDFVSASAIDIDSVAACDVPTEIAGKATITDGSAQTGISTPAPGKACACGKSVCTPGRICLKDDTDEGNDQCYLPRCNMDDAAVKVEYYAGCVCGGDSVFKTGIPSKVILSAAASPGLPVCADGEVTTARCVCGATAATAGNLVCDAGVLCDQAKVGTECGGKAGGATADVWTSLEALIVPGNLTDPAKFAICKNTNSGGQVKCVPDAEDGKFCVKA